MGRLHCSSFHCECHLRHDHGPHLQERAARAECLVPVGERRTP